MNIKDKTMYGHTVTYIVTSSKTCTIENTRNNPNNMTQSLQVESLSSSEEVYDFLSDETAETDKADASTCTGSERRNYVQGKDEASLTEKSVNGVSVSTFQTRVSEVSKNGHDFTSRTTEISPETVYTYTETILYDEEEAFFILCEDTGDIPCRKLDAETSDLSTETSFRDKPPCADARSNVEKPAISSQIQPTTDTESDSCTITTNESLTISEQEADYFLDNVQGRFSQATWQPSGLIHKDDVTHGQTKDTTQERPQPAGEVCQVTGDTTEPSDHTSLIPELEKHLNMTEEKLLQSQQHFLHILAGHGNDHSLLTPLPSSSHTTGNKYDNTLSESSEQRDSNDNVVMASSQEENRTVTGALVDKNKDVCIKETGKGSEENMSTRRSSLRCAENPQSYPLKRVRFSEKLIIELDKFGDFLNSKVIDISKGTPIEKLSGTFDDIRYKSRTFFKTALFKTVFDDHNDHFKPPAIQKRSRKNRRRRKGSSLSTSKKQLVYSVQSVGTLWL
ncbi:uncharacterized protein [Branchiostoma lanceolatum]|uniref:uncharacterized protein n=1 Tax=Branchiostoma lanceolatum TaxID=7740 RepID=UPI003454815E